MAASAKGATGLNQERRGTFGYFAFVGTGVNIKAAGMDGFQSLLTHNNPVSVG